MTELKSKMAASCIFAILAGLLLAGVSYVFFPDPTSGQMPTPKPSPSWLEQFSWAMLWIGIALFISLTIVGVIRITGKIRNKRDDQEILSGLALGQGKNQKLIKISNVEDIENINQS